MVVTKDICQNLELAVFLIEILTEVSHLHDILPDLDFVTKNMNDFIGLDKESRKKFI